ncbi:hypothetical protein GC093_27945 [Paenibacillus sp. LMG 31456]|uniref:Uncharacterized protein n=1 Tax=Paenibacillus foliorum TaxID=2654974 RepID=A0A972K5H0_9BACL|nr:hypothetical protein [Paenibacillus foliorum]NOU97027.1 hypothetical protein [Paenibacillus foliorum]
MRMTPSSVTIAKLRSVSDITIYKDCVNQYCVKISGENTDGKPTSGLLDVWNTQKEAMSCAKGIAKMFNFTSIQMK